jgi:hypothetical protein
MFIADITKVDKSELMPIIIAKNILKSDSLQLQYWAFALISFSYCYVNMELSRARNVELGKSKVTLQKFLPQCCVFQTTLRQKCLESDCT